MGISENIKPWEIFNGLDAWKDLSDEECRKKWDELCRQDEESEKKQQENNKIAFENKLREIKRELFGDRHVACELSQLRGEESFHKKIQEFLSDPLRILFYSGNAGVGKTFFCSCMFNHISHVHFKQSQSSNIAYYTERELLKQVRSSMDEKGDYLQCLQRLINRRVVILDDVCSSGYNSWREEILFCFLDERYNKKLPTIITSNLSMNDIKKTYDNRIYSRLNSKENIIIERFNAPDLRQG